MADEIMEQDDDLASLGSEFGIDENLAETVTLDEEEVVLAEDLEGFAKGFPDWDLLPPQK